MANQHEQKVLNEKFILSGKKQAHENNIYNYLKNRKNQTANQSEYNHIEV